MLPWKFDWIFFFQVSLGERFHWRWSNTRYMSTVSWESTAYHWWHFICAKVSCESQVKFAAIVLCWALVGLEPCNVNFQVLASGLLPGNMTFRHNNIGLDSLGFFPCMAQVQTMPNKELFLIELWKRNIHHFCSEMPLGYLAYGQWWLKNSILLLSRARPHVRWPCMIFCLCGLCRKSFRLLSKLQVYKGAYYRPQPSPSI